MIIKLAEGMGLHIASTCVMSRQVSDVGASCATGPGLNLWARQIPLHLLPYLCGDLNWVSEEGTGGGDPWVAVAPEEKGHGASQFCQANHWGTGPQFLYLRESPPKCITYRKHVFVNYFGREASGLQVFYFFNLKSFLKHIMKPIIANELLPELCYVF